MPKLHDYICIQCNKSFQNRKLNKKFCSDDCMMKHRHETKLKESSWKFEKRNCLECSSEFIPTYKPQRYCSRGCSMSVAGKLKTEIGTYDTTCAWCSKQFSKRLTQRGKHNDFCSIVCGEAFKRGNQDKYVTKICKNKNCNKEFETLYRRQAEFCSKSCMKSGEYHHFYNVKGELNPNHGMTPWTKGLTKETDERLANLSKKVSETHKKQFGEGTRDNAGENNPNHPNKRKNKERSIEALKNYSNGAAFRVQNYILGQGEHGSYFCNKTKKTLKYKSSFEKTMMKLLDFDPDVKWFEYETLKINYSKNRTYVPDFIVYYSSGSSKILEIKGWIRDKEKHFSKLEAATEYCSNRNMSYEVWFKLDIDKYENELKEKGLLNNEQS